MLTRDEYLKRINKNVSLRADEWEDIRDTLFEALVHGEAPIYEREMNELLQATVNKYLRPTDEYFSLTDIARKFDDENPSYLIQSWLRNRNTVEFLGSYSFKANCFLPFQSNYRR